MTRPDPRAARPARRAVAVGALLLASALAAHAVAGGPLPSSGALVVPAGLSVLIGAVLTSGRPARSTSLLLVSASQYAVHTLLTLSASRAARDPGAAAGGAGAGTGCAPVHGHGSVVDCLAAGGPPDPAAAAPGDATMLALHVAATIATAALLAQGDRLLAWVRASLRPVWRRAPRVPVVGGPARVAVPGPPVPALSTQVWGTLPPRRGPPRGTGVAAPATT